MEWYFILLLCIIEFCALYAIFALFVAKRVLTQATKPVRHTEDEARIRQSEQVGVDFS